MKKWQTLIEAHVDVKTTDGYVLRLFCIGFTKRRAGQVKKTCYAMSSQIRQIRKKMMEIMSREANSCDLKVLLPRTFVGCMNRSSGESCIGAGCGFGKGPVFSWMYFWVSEPTRRHTVIDMETCVLQELVGKFIPEAIGKDIEKACAGIYPLQNVYIRKCKVLKVRLRLCCYSAACLQTSASSLSCAFPLLMSMAMCLPPKVSQVRSYEADGSPRRLHRGGACQGGAPC